MKPGQFITFEGIDGAGKSTQMSALENWLRSQGIEVIRTREPGGTPLAETIRTLLLERDMNVTTETLLFFAARSEHLGDVILPALARGAWVLSDRFTDSTFAYQVGAKRYSPRDVEMLERLVQRRFRPHHTVLFDLDPMIAAKRRAAARAADRFEVEDVDFFVRVRYAYLNRAWRNPKRFLILDASQSPESITKQLLDEAQRWL